MAKIKAFGTALQIDIASTLTTIAALREINGPGATFDTVDVTTMDNAAAAHEYLATLFDAGEVTFQLLFDPVAATFQAITDAFDGTLTGFNIIWPDAASTDWPFNAIITGVEPTGVVDGALMVNVTLKGSGSITYPT